MSRVTPSHPLEFGATEPRTEGFREHGSLLSGLLNIGKIFGNASLPASPADLSLPRIIGELPRPASLPMPLAEEPAAVPARHAEPAPTPADEIERLVLHVAASDRPARAKRLLVTHAPGSDHPLSHLDCTAFASQFARALALEGRAILVVFGAGSASRPGLSELIDGSASFSQAIHREAGSRLHILPAGYRRSAAGDGLAVVMDALAETYDFVILAVLDEDSVAQELLARALAPRIDHAVIGCVGPIGSPETVAMRDALRQEGAAEIIAARIGLSARGEMAA
jgi:hypothetical protein